MITVKNTFAGHRLALVLMTVFIPCLLTRANIVGPYTADANTLFLLHFDEAAGGSVTTNVGIKGGNFITVTNTTTGSGLAAPPIVTTMLGQTAYTNVTAQIGFGNCVSATNVVDPTLYPTVDGIIGYDGNKDGSYEGDVQSSGTPSADSIALTNLNIGVNGVTPFTIEALICPTTLGANQEILCTDSYWANTTPSRGFQFKITNTGLLQFNIIPVAGGSQSATIPSIGTDPDNGFVAHTWYHVAATYDGSLLKLYWTKLDPSNTVANLIGSFAVGAIYGVNTNVEPVVIGNENRGSSGEDFLGLIDEVRISSVARAANGMQFYSPLVTINPQPVSQNIDDGQPVTFTVNASSLTTLGYQWRFNGTPIPGASAFATNASSYTIASVNLTNAGSYDCVVTNISGNSATSSPAMLVVGAGNFLSHRYSFTTDDTDSIGGANGTNNGNATVSGGKLVLDGTSGTYMQLPGGMFHGLQAATFDFWASYGTISGNNDHVFDFGNTNGVALGIPGQPNNYLYFSPHSGTVNRLTGTPGTSEFEQTVSATGILDGQTVHVTCVVDPPDKYLAIYTNGVLEAANTNYTIPFVSLSDQLAYVGRSLFAELNGDAYLNGSIDEFRIYSGALSAASVLQSDAQGPNTLLNDGPVQLVTQPVDTTTAPGLTVTLSGSASGHLPITYQWFENGGLIPNATNTTYSFVASLGQNAHTFQFVATNNITGTNYIAASTNATLTVVNPPTLVWLGANSDTWDTSTLNWTNVNTASLVAYGQFDSAIFDNRGGAQPTVDLTQSQNPLSITVSNSTIDYTFMSSGNNGSLTGVGTLTKANTGKLTIDVTNAMTGWVSISGGTLQVGNNDTLGAIGSPVTNNASLILDRSDSIVLPSPIYGTGTVTMNSGNITASSSNYYTGATLINSGVTSLANSAGLGATNGGITVNGDNNGELYITANVDIGLKPLTLGGPGSSGAGALRKGGAGTTTYYGTVTLTDDTTLNVDGSATLNLTNSAGLVASSSASLILNGSGAGNIAGPLALGSGSLTVNGGTWTLNSPVNNYSGKAFLNGGTLMVGAEAALGSAPGSFTADQITLGNGTTGGLLGAFTSFALDDGLRGITVNTVGGFVTPTNVTLTIANAIAGSGTITKSGGGTLILNGNNSFSGTLNTDTSQAGVPGVNDGVTRIASPNAIGGVSIIQIRNNNAGFSTLQFDGSNGALTIAPVIVAWSGRNNNVPAIENVTGDNTFSPIQINWVGGGGIYPIQSDTNTLTISTAIPTLASAPPAGFRNVMFSGSGNILMSAAVQDNSGSMTNGVIKTGSGTLTLSAANAYSGGTIISNGVVLVDGSIMAGGAVTNVGGTLGGVGTINSPVFILPGATLSPGDSGVGTLTVNNNMTIAGNLLFPINKSLSPSNSVAVVSGALANTGTGALTLTNSGPALVVGDTFKLFSQPVSGGAALSVTGAGVVWNNNLALDGSVSVASLVVPHPVINSVSLNGANLILAGTNGTAGGMYYVLSSTNVALPLTQWAPVLTNKFDSSGNFAVTNAVAPGVSQQFYILELP